MSPVKKSPVQKNYQNNKGQLSIFFALVLIMLVTVMGFVVNIGIFVKTRINLQNAVDAAAWSGAAVQARQLTRLSYLNWEMRNIFKEWMYKYYVVGSLGLAPLEGPHPGNPDLTDFRLRNIAVAAGAGEDKYNIPSVCIHFAGTTNICRIFTVPGIPRFEPVGLPGLDETNQAFIQAITESKARDCSIRSRLNFTVASLWTFGLRGGLEFQPPGGPTGEVIPNVALERIGAWPRALELALRMRNLEYVVNDPPKEEVNIATVGDYIQAAGEFPVHERTVKAFYSAYRNLAKADGPNGNGNGLKRTFTLRELRPNLALSTDNLATPSYFLIPEGYEKYYLDLQLYALNYALFYTNFASTQNSDAGGGPVQVAQCAGTKIAIPVPFYPLGYVKNNKVLTYYAVEGTARFFGLFNPFLSESTNGIEIKAYAAAKPFGGKIGPALFNVEGGSITPRALPAKSYPYTSSVIVSGGAFDEGYPIPSEAAFWAPPNQSTRIGGRPNDDPNVRFVQPNLLYDYDTNMNNQQPNSSDVSVVELTEFSGGATTSNNILGGLYSASQFTKFSQGLRNGTPQTILDAIFQARAPTRYEADNYMIPTLDIDSQASNLASVGIQVEDGNGTPSEPFRLRVEAPLYGPNLLYQDVETLVNEGVNTILSSSDLAVESYLNAMDNVAKSIRVKGGLSPTETNTSAGPYVSASLIIHDNPNAPQSPSCNSIAGRFKAFFLGTDGISGDTTSCPDWIQDNIQTLWNDGAPSLGGDAELFRQYWLTEYVRPIEGRDDTGAGTSVANAATPDYMKAYNPGLEYGGDGDLLGTVTNPFTTSLGSESHLRNFYSTKFIPFSMLSSGGGGSFMAIFSEGNPSPLGDAQSHLSGQFENYLSENPASSERILH